MQALEFEAGYSRRGNLYAGDTQKHQYQYVGEEYAGKRPTVSTSKLTA